MKTLTVLRKGTFTDHNKNTVTVDDAMLDKIVEFSKRAAKGNAREIPIVKGHPKVEDPKYGGIGFGSVMRVGDTLQVTPSWVDPTLAEQVEQRKYDAVSLKFNANTGKIIHLGVLGAAAPAVDGLPVLEFSEEDNAPGVVELADSRMSEVADVLRKLREDIIANRGTEVADSLIPIWSINVLSQDVREVPQYISDSVDTLYTRIDDIYSRLYDIRQQLESTSQTISFTTNEGTTMTVEQQLAEAQQKLAESEKLLEAERAKSASAEREKDAVEFAALLDAPERKGKLTAEERNQVITLMHHLKDSSGTVEFASQDAEGKVEKFDPLKLLLSLVDKSGEIVSLAQGVSSEGVVSPANTPKLQEDVDDIVRAGNRHSGVQPKK